MEKNTVAEIRRQTSLQLKKYISEEMIWLALDKLKSEKLLSNHQEIGIDYNNLSRREVIRKVGISTMAALPLILTITSPKSVAAQSLVCSSTFCRCSDPTCLQLGPVAVLQTPCADTACSGSGGNNCQCVGLFFCFGVGERFGACRLT